MHIDQSCSNCKSKKIVTLIFPTYKMKELKETSMCRYFLKIALCTECNFIKQYITNLDTGACRLMSGLINPETSDIESGFVEWADEKIVKIESIKDEDYV